MIFTVSEATMMLSSLACHVHTASVGLSSSNMPWPKLGCLHNQNPLAIRHMYEQVCMHMRRDPCKALLHHF